MEISQRGDRHRIRRRHLLVRGKAQRAPATSIGRAAVHAAFRGEFWILNFEF
jgi:hypothetical protein